MLAILSPVIFGVGGGFFFFPVIYLFTYFISGILEFRLILAIGVVGATEMQVFSLPYKYAFPVVKFTKGETVTCLP